MYNIQIQTDSVVSDTSRFINFWLRSLATRGERQFLKAYANHTILTPCQRAAHLVTFKTTIYLCRSRSEKLNHRRNGRKLNSRLNGRISTLWSSTFEYPSATLNGRISTDVLSKSSTSHSHLFRAWRHPHSNTISCLGGYYDKQWLSYPLRASVNLTNDYAPELRNSNSSKPYQTEW